MGISVIKLVYSWSINDKLFIFIGVCRSGVELLTMLQIKLKIAEIIFLLNLLDNKVSTDTLTSLVKKHTKTNKSKWQRGNKHSSMQLELSPVRKALANRICGSKILIFMLRRVRLGQRKKWLYKLYHEEDRQRGEEYKNLGMQLH